MAGVFSSAAASGKRELIIKKSASSPEASAIESGNFVALFSVTSLNHLQVTGFSSLTSLPPEVGKLGDLLQLILSQNALTEIPCEISTLPKLKHLDISQNKLSSIPDSLYSLHTLQTLVLSHNALTDASFPTPPANALSSLHHIDLIGNKLTRLPDFIYCSHGIQELKASDNSIMVIESSVGQLAGLKHIDLKRNRLTTLPHELSSCSKLRVISFEENPLSDRRLLKLVGQHGSTKPKAVLDYISSHAPKATPLTKTGAKKGKNKTKTSGAAPAVNDGDDDDDVIFASKKTQISIVRPPQYVEVVASSNARAVRPYLVCAIVRGVDLEDEEAYKEFISLQTRLHDTVCKRRRVATIATHNLESIKSPIHYSCECASDISLTPLSWTKTTTAEEFIHHLEASKEKRGGAGGGGGKGKKVTPVKTAPAASDATAVALSKYLQFVDAEAMVFLQDSTDTVISLPPLTNSERSKIDSETTELFLEVTSADSLASCKQVMDALVCGMCEMGLGVRKDMMSVEQVKVVSDTGQLLVLYPSRTDLTDTVFDVLRPT